MHKTPLLDQLVPGPFPSFVKDLKQNDFKVLDDKKPPTQVVNYNSTVTVTLPAANQALSASRQAMTAPTKPPAIGVLKIRPSIPVATGCQ